MYSSLEGTTYFNQAEKIAIEGKESNYSNGWEDRWKKCKRLIENLHLRKFRLHWYEINYNSNDSFDDGGFGARTLCRQHAEGVVTLNS